MKNFNIVIFTYALKPKLGEMEKALGDPGL